MERILAVPLFFVSLMSLRLCSNVTKRTNFIVPGIFIGTNEYEDGTNKEEYCLKIAKISEDVYAGSNGKNVIKDEVRSGYYSIVFFKVGVKDEPTYFDFFNFKDAYNGATGTPICYVDDNGWRLVPFTNNYQDDEQPTYMISMTKNEPKIFSYCYLKEEKA